MQAHNMTLDEVISHLNMNGDQYHHKLIQAIEELQAENEELRAEEREARIIADFVQINMEVKNMLEYECSPEGGENYFYDLADMIAYSPIDNQLNNLFPDLTDSEREYITDFLVNFVNSKPVCVDMYNCYPYHTGGKFVITSSGKIGEIENEPPESLKAAIERYGMDFNEVNDYLELAYYGNNDYIYFDLSDNCFDLVCDIADIEEALADYRERNA